MTSDIDGIHIYTMNKIEMAKKIMDSITNIRADFEGEHNGNFETTK